MDNKNTTLLKPTSLVVRNVDEIDSKNYHYHIQPPPPFYDNLGPNNWYQSLLIEVTNL